MNDMTKVKKDVYQPPIVTVVDFRVEDGYQGSGNVMQLESAGHHLFHRDEYYERTGDVYTEFTGDDGQFSRGSW